MPQTLFVSPEDDLQAVFDRAEENAIIHLAPGQYRQKLMIRTPGLTLIGAGAEQTQIVFGDYAKSPIPSAGNSIPSGLTRWRSAQMVLP